MDPKQRFKIKVIANTVISGSIKIPKPTAASITQGKMHNSKPSWAGRNRLQTYRMMNSKEFAALLLTLSFVCAGAKPVCVFFFPPLSFFMMIALFVVTAGASPWPGPDWDASEAAVPVNSAAHAGSDGLDTVWSLIFVSTESKACGLQYVWSQQLTPWGVETEDGVGGWWSGCQ